MLAVGGSNWYNQVRVIMDGPLSRGSRSGSFGMNVTYKG